MYRRLPKISLSTRINQDSRLRDFIIYMLRTVTHSLVYYFSHKSIFILYFPNEKLSSAPSFWTTCRCDISESETLILGQNFRETLDFDDKWPLMNSDAELQQRFMCPVRWRIADASSYSTELRSCVTVFTILIPLFFFLQSFNCTKIYVLKKFLLSFWWTCLTLR